MAEQFLGEIRERQILLKATTDRNYPEGTRNTNKGVDLYCKYFTYIILPFSRALLSHLACSCFFFVRDSCYTIKRKNSKFIALVGM